MAVIIRHEFGKRGRESIEHGTIHTPWFLLTNNKGAFASFSCPQQSRYQGVYFNRDFRLFKIIEDIMPTNAGEVIKLTNKAYCIERTRKNVDSADSINSEVNNIGKKNQKNQKTRKKAEADEMSEIFFMPKNHDALYYELDQDKEILIKLDGKEMHDNKKYGRYYSIELDNENKRIIVEFTKKTDEKEDKSHGMSLYKIFCVISGDIKIPMKVDKFEKAVYSYDRSRNSWPFERDVYNAFTVRASRLFITFSNELNDAVRENDNLKANIEKFVEERKKECLKPGTKKIKNKEISFAYNNALHSLFSLQNEIAGRKGISAGFPWFPYYRTRDEIVSLGALMLENRFGYVKEILFQKLREINAEGMAPLKYPHSQNDLRCADTAGLIFKRIGDFIDILEERKILLQYIKRDELYFIKNKLEEVIAAQLKYHTSDNLAVNKKLETWITPAAGSAKERIDTRAGKRIEIQALRLNMYKLLRKLAAALNDEISHDMAKELENDMKRKVLEEFYKNNYLWDAPDDDTMRTAVFIAFYVYPGLLTKKEWFNCFKIMLPELFYAWGGLSSIEKSSKYFKEIHSGENNLSYYHGDSWYWMNNLAAICLIRTARFSFKDEIRRILDASTKEILWMGVAGAHAEISSAKHQESFGCLSQAWSSAMYAELVHELL